MSGDGITPLGELFALLMEQSSAPFRVIAEAAAEAVEVVSRWGDDPPRPALVLYDRLWRSFAAHDPSLFPGWAAGGTVGSCLALGFAEVAGDGTIMLTDLSITEREAFELLAETVRGLAGINLPEPTIMVVGSDTALGRALSTYGPAVGYAPTMVPELRSTVVLPESVLSSWRAARDADSVADCVVHELVHGVIAARAFGSSSFDTDLFLAAGFEEAVVRLVVAAGATVAAGVSLDEEILETLAAIYQTEGALRVATKTAFSRASLSNIVDVAVAAHQETSEQAVLRLLNEHAVVDWTQDQWSAIFPL